MRWQTQPPTLPSVPCLGSADEPRLRLLPLRPPRAHAPDDALGRVPAGRDGALGRAARGRPAGVRPREAGALVMGNERLRAREDAEFFGDLAHIAVLWPQQWDALERSYRYARLAARAARRAFPELCE